MASLLSWAGHQVKRLENTIHNDVVSPVQRAAHSVQHQAQGAVAQVNPADGGRTYHTVMQNKPAPKPYVSAIKQLTHNGATNLTGGVVKPLAQFPLDTGALAYNHVVAPAFDLPKQNLKENPILGGVSRYADATGTPRQTVGSGIQTGLTIGTGGLGKGVEKAFTSVAPKVIPKLATKTIANAGTGAIVGAPFNVASTISSDQPLTVKNLKNSAIQGAQAGALLGGAGTLAGAAAPVVAKSAVRVARKAPEAAKAVSTPAPVRRIDATLAQYKKAFDVETNPTRRKQISRGIADLNTQRRNMAEGGYVKNPLGGDNLPSAEQKVFAQNPMNPENAVKLPQSSSAPVSGDVPQLKEILPTAAELEARVRLPAQKTAEKGSPLPNDTPLPTINTKRVNSFDKAARSTRSIIEHQGEHGKQLAGMLEGSRDTKEQYLAALQKQMPTVMKLGRDARSLVKVNKNKDFENFVNATQGLEQPANARVAKAVAEWQATHPQIRQAAVNAGLDVGDLGPKYYPHFIDYEQIFKDKNTFNQAVNHLVESGQAPDQAAAIKLLGFARDVSRNRQFGNLEASRLVDLPMYDKTPNSLLSYLTGSAKRISDTQTFGKGDEKALDLITKAGQQGFDTEAMKNAYDIAVGAKQYNPTTQKISGNIRSYITTTRLGLGAITNSSQNVNTGIVTGHFRTLGAAIKQLNPKTRAFVGDTGVIADAVLQDIKTQSGFTSLPGKTMARAKDAITAPGFATVEKFNRSVAATAGRDYGLRLAQKGDEATLRRLGVTGEIKGKTLTDAQQIQIARKVVEKTQFKVDPQDLPGWADTPGGKLVAQFRTFSYNQGKFFSNEILKPASTGNLLPLSRLMAALPVGYALYETKRAIAGRPEEDNKGRVGVEAFGNIGGAGLALDLFRSMVPLNNKTLTADRRVSMAAGTFGGPAVGVGTEFVGSVSNAAPKVLGGSSDAKQLGRSILKQVPIVGTAIQNRVLPYTTKLAVGGEDIALKPQQAKDYQKIFDGKLKPLTAQIKAQNLDKATETKQLAAAKKDATVLAKADYLASINRGDIKIDLTARQKHILNGEQVSFTGKTKGGSKTTSSVTGADGKKTTVPKIPTATKATTTTYDPKAKLWTQTNNNTGRVTQIDSSGARTIVNKGIGAISGARPDYIANIRSLSTKYKLDTPAVLAVAAAEGLGGGVGDNGTSFGPFQLHVGGALPKGKDQKWAESPAGIEYALQQISKVAGGKKGQAAITAIVNSFERPADPNNEIANALSVYTGKGVKLTPGEARSAKYAGTKKVKSTGKSSVATQLATLKATTVKPQKKVANPNITVKTTGTPSTYKQTALRKYAVKKAAISKTKRA